MSLKEFIGQWLFRAKREDSVEVWHEIGWIFALIFIVWGMYRFLSPFPIWIEETLLKGIVFGGPVFWVTFKRLKWSFADLGISPVRLLPGVYMGLLLGILMGLLGQLGNLMRYGRIRVSDYGLTSESLGGFLLLALITAFWEQLVFAGYILRRMYGSLKNEMWAILSAALFFVMIHFPALLIVQHLTGMALLLAVLLLFTLQLGCGILRIRLGNLAAPMMAQALWGVTLYLFR